MNIFLFNLQGYRDLTGAGNLNLENRVICEDFHAIVRAGEVLTYCGAASEDCDLDFWYLVHVEKGFFWVKTLPA